MSQTSVNGEKPTSLTVNHITSYPLPADLISIYESHPLGAKSLHLLHNLYATLAANLSPYLQTPYSILAPYLERADHLGNNTLSSLDERFPAVKETDLNTVKSNAHALASYPFQLAGQGKDYVFNTYADEYKKIGGNGNVIHMAKSMVSTELRIAMDGVNVAKEWLGPKTEEAKEKYAQGKKLATEKLSQAQKIAAQKKGQAEKIAKEKADQAEKIAKEKADQAQQKGEEVANGHA